MRERLQRNRKPICCRRKTNNMHHEIIRGGGCWSIETWHCVCEAECTTTLKARDYKDPTVVVYGIGEGMNWDGTETAPTLTSRNAGGGQRMPDKENFNCVIGENNMSTVVRRLTPLECERLQGYPDGWTDIGEWVDSKGKKHKDADSPRYKALGNSIALPFWDWMAERMVKELGSDKPTMASLFDGIGGFPLVYQRHGCEPVWASEIEEFPIAVTRIRFPDET